MLRFLRFSQLHYHFLFVKHWHQLLKIEQYSKTINGKFVIHPCVSIKLQSSPRDSRRVNTTRHRRQDTIGPLANRRRVSNAVRTDSESTRTRNESIQTPDHRQSTRDDAGRARHSYKRHSQEHPDLVQPMEEVLREGPGRNFRWWTVGCRGWNPRHHPAPSTEKRQNLVLGSPEKGEIGEWMCRLESSKY